MGGCPFLKGSFIGGSTTPLILSKIGIYFHHGSSSHLEVKFMTEANN